MKLTKQHIEEQGFIFKRKNHVRQWFEKTFPEVGGNFYGYNILKSQLIHDEEQEKLEIKYDFEGADQWETVFEGWCPTLEDFQFLMKLLRLK